MPLALPNVFYPPESENTQEGMRQGRRSLRGQSQRYQGSFRRGARGGPLGGKLLVVFLWNHSCGGSNTMGEITYPDGVAQA